MLGLIAAAAWVPGTSRYFHLRPAVPLAMLALACAYGFGVNTADARRPFSPPALLASAIVYGALVQLFTWSLVFCSDDPGALALANGPVLVAASHALRLRPTPRFPWPLAGHALGTGAAFLLAPPDRAIAVLFAAPLTLALALLVGPYAERLRRSSGLVAQHADAIHARELEARAAELSGLSASLLELMQRGHDSRSALSGALLDAEQLERAAARLPGGDGAALRAGAASLRATLERLRQLVDTRRGLLSSSASRDAADPAVKVMPAVLVALAAARLRGSSARLAAHATPGAEDARARIAGGEESLARMLDILLENGWQGNGIRGASRVEVEVSAEERTGALAIAVRDNGPGFPPDVLARPLAPFVTTKPGALGLGLYTAERLVRASGGSLERANSAGGGAVVTLFLQLAPPEEPGAASGGVPPAQA
jgi:signal transduction histidine kinase